MNQLDNMNPLIISSQMPQMEDYNMMQKDDYFETDQTSISFKNRDLFANFGGVDQENHQQENYATKPPNRSDDLNSTHQSLKSGKDERIGQNAVTNRINPGVLQNGSSSNIKSVKSKFAGNKMLYQSQHNPLQNR